MRLYVLNFKTVSLCKSGQCTYLIHYVSLCICGAYVHIAPAEAHKIGVTGVCAEINVVFFKYFNRLIHNHRVGSVKSAGYVCR